MCSKFVQKKGLQPKRIFSEVVRKQAVSDVESGKITVREISRDLMVSEQAIYKWIYRYSRYLMKNKVMVVEDQSEKSKTKELEARLRQVEAALGRKQMEVDFLSKMIDLANEEYKLNIKKNLPNVPFNGFRQPEE